MKKYTVSVRKAGSMYSDGLELKADSTEEVMQIVNLMMKNGHVVTVMTEDARQTEEERDKELENELKAYSFKMEEKETEAVGALAG